MFHKFKVCTFALIAFGFASYEVTAGEELMDGVRPFICDGGAIVFLETNNGWVITADPTAEVKRTVNGWRYEDPLNGDVWYLREEGRSSWVIDGLSEDGSFKFDCTDVADNVSQVVSVIKPRLNDAIAGTQEALARTQEALARANANLGIAEQNRVRLLADHEAELSRVNRALELAVQSKDELTKRVETSKQLLNNNLENYDKLLKAAVSVPSLGGKLIKLRDASPSDRNDWIRNSSLGKKGLAGNGLVPVCIKLLRDKRDLNEACHQTLTEFVILEGWD